MADEHVNRETVQSRLARLDREYGVDYREDETVTVDPEAFPRELSMARDGYDGSSYVWIVRSQEQAPSLSESMAEKADPAEDRVLMILGRGGHEWGIPGGGREGDETLEDGALREVDEEVGVDCTITDLYGVRYERRTSPEHDETLHTLRAVFEGEYESGQIQMQPGEVAGAAWLARRPRRVHPLARPIADEWFDAGE